MAKLDETQERLIQTVQETKAKVQATLDELELEYEHAVFRAKAPVIEAIKTAEESGVPRIRIARDGLNMTYVGKMDSWCRPADVVINRAMQGNIKVEATQAFAETVAETKAVTRDNNSGRFSVIHGGDTYTVESYGPADEAWSSAEPGIPQRVYDLIQEAYPTWTLLENDD